MGNCGYNADTMLWDNDHRLPKTWFDKFVEICIYMIFQCGYTDP